MGFQEILESTGYPEFKNKLSNFPCPRCPALVKERHNIVVDRGNPEAKIVVIGEAPGANEDLEGKSFVGRGGKLLDKLMNSIGLDTNEDALVLNVAKCRPPNNRPPTPEEARNCRPYLQWQLDYVKPSIIVLLGATAARHFLPDAEKSMKDKVGRFLTTAAYPGVRFLTLYHPAYLLRDPRKIPLFKEHLSLLKTEIVELNKGGVEVK